MILPEVYLMLIMAGLIFILSLWMKDVHIQALSMILFMLIGINIIMYGFEGVINFVTETMGMILIGGGFLILVKGYYDEYKDAF